MIRYENLAILAIGGAAMVLVDRLIKRTRIGASVRAVAQDAEAAQMMGVDLDRTVDFTFFLGAALAAVAGVLNGLYYSEIHFIMGIMAGVIGFSAAAFIPRGSEFRDVVAFAVVMVFMVLKPTGILGEKPIERV